MEQMQAEPGTLEVNPIRSKYRGLSWDKKYQGWRVRIYYSGKQRHVGRFEDELSAARAYDKAAVCLYGTCAITNFGLEACLQDPTEVSSFILQAKEKADQEQQSRAAQNAHKQAYRPGLVGGLSPAQLQAAVQHGVVMAPAYQQAQQMYHVQQGQQQQQQQQQQQGMMPALTADGLQQQLLVAGGYPVAHSSSITFSDVNSLQQQPLVCSSGDGRQQKPLQLSALPADGSSYVLMSSPLTTADSLSNMSCLNSSSLSSSNSTASSYMLCSTPSGQTLMLPVASPAMSGFNGGSGDVSVLLQAQQQVLQVPQFQQQVQQFQQQVPQIQQQQQQPQLLLVSAAGEPLQLSVQPEMITIAGHLSAAAAPSAANNSAELLPDPPGLHQQLLQQQMQDMSMLSTMPPCSLGYNNALQDWRLAGHQQQLAGGSSTPAGGSPMQQALMGGAFSPDAAAAGGGGALCGTSSMTLVPMPGYATPAAAALPSRSSAGNTSGVRLSQQQLFRQLSGQMLLDGRTSGSSNCSPMMAALQMQVPGMTGSIGVASVTSNRAFVPAPAGLSSNANVRGHQAGSPTLSSCSSGSDGRMLVGVNGAYSM